MCERDLRFFFCFFFVFWQGKICGNSVTCIVRESEKVEILHISERNASIPNADMNALHLLLPLGCAQISLGANDLDANKLCAHTSQNRGALLNVCLTIFVLCGALLIRWKQIFFVDFSA